MGVRKEIRLGFLAWVGLAAWHLTRSGAAFIPLLATGLFAFSINCMALAAPHNHATIVAGAHT